jgi:hypothetical protein
MTKLKEILSRVLGIGPIRYQITYQSYATPKSALVKGNSFIFINLSTTSTAIIDYQIILLPLQSFSVPGELFEHIEQKFEISFPSGSGSILIVVKTYE